MKTFINLVIVVTIGTMLTSPIIAGQQTTSASQTSGTSLSPTLDRKHKDKTRTRDRSPVTREKKDRINRVRPSSSPRISSSLATYRSPIITTSALSDTLIRTASWGPDSSIAERDDGHLEYPLPFTFPYFGRSIIALDVNTNGLIELLESGESCVECGDYMTRYYSVHVDSSMDAIFALNDDLVTSTIIEGSADAVKVSWFGSTYFDYDDSGDIYNELSFSVTLFSDGRIQWKYFDIDYANYDGDLFSGLYDAIGDVELAVPGMPTLGEPVHKLFEFDPAYPDTIPQLTWNPNDISLYFEDDADLYYYGYEDDYYSLPFTFPFLGRDIVQINVNSNGLVELLEVGGYDVGYYGSCSYYWEEYEDAIFVANDDLETGIVVEGTSEQVDIYWYGLTYNDYSFEDEGTTMKLTLFRNGGVKWTFFDMNYTDYDCYLFSGLASFDAGVELEVPGGSLAFNGVQVYTAFRYNGAPTAEDDAAVTAEDNPVLIDVLANDTEAEGDALSLVNVTQGVHGAVVNNGDGTITYTPVADYNGADTLTYTASDGISGTDTATVSLTVIAVNDAPTIAVVPDPAAIDEDAAEQVINLSGIGTGAANESQALIVTATSDNPGLIPDPVVTYASPQATGSLSYTPVPNSNGTAVITVKVKDDGGTANGGVDSVLTTFTVTVNAVNDASTVAAVSDPAAIDEDAGQQSVDLTGIGTGAANETQTLTVTATSSNTGLIPDPAVTYTSPAATGTLTYTPVADAYGMATITVVVKDDGGTANGGVDSVLATFTVMVNAVNDAPIIAAISDPAAIDVDAGQQSVDLTGIGTGAANETQILTVTATSSNTGLIPDPAVTYTSPDATGTLTYTPLADAYGTAIITVMVKDDGGTANGGVDSVLTTFTVTVNDAPVAVADTVTTPEDTAVTVLVLANDSDADGDTLTLASITQGNHGVVVIDEGDTTLTYTPNANFWGVDSLTYTVSDGKSGQDTATVLVTVTSVNDPPEAFALVSPGHDSTLVITNDNLGDTLTFAWGGAVDVDGDTVRYGAELTGDLGAILIFGDTTATEVRLPHAAVAELMEGLGLLTITGTWDIFATDGEYTTRAENGPFALTIDATSLDVLRQALLPETFALHQNYPNPFNPSTTLQVDVPEAGDIHIVVYDLLGQEVVRLVEQRLEAGYHQLVWNGKDRRGREVPTGMYIVLMATPEFRKSIKLVLLK